jgi:FkbM family methyltransferase
MGIEYLDRYFHFDKSLVGDNPVFLEIGSYSGGNMKRLLKSFPESRIVIYEAGIDNFKNLERNYNKIGRPDNVSIHNKAVADSDGEIRFFEYKDKSSSNSVFERHIKKKSLIVEREHVITSTNLQGILRDNNLEKIDVVFANAEGIEVMLLGEVSTNKAVRSRVSQLCLSMHERIVGKDAIERSLTNASKFYSFKEGEGKWAAHLFRRRDLL